MSKIGSMFLQDTLMSSYEASMSLSRLATRLILLSTLTFFDLPKAYSWGVDGHELINKAAAELLHSELRALFANNHVGLERLANVPDFHWRDAADPEKSAHYFRWDTYFESPLGNTMPIPMDEAISVVGYDYVMENGTAVWRADQIYKMLVESLTAKDWKRSIQLAGVLGHYIGDLSQPMHVTSDYDGQSIGRYGIHKYFESTFIARLDQKRLYEDVLSRATYLARTRFGRARSMSVVEVAFDQAVRSIQYMPELTEAFKADAKPSAEILYPKVVELLANGAVSLWHVWDRAADEANVVNPPVKEMTVEDPDWIPLP
jgi:hypothetical protein